MLVSTREPVYGNIQIRTVYIREAILVSKWCTKLDQLALRNHLSVKDGTKQSGCSSTNAANQRLPCGAASALPSAWLQWHEGIENDVL